MVPLSKRGVSGGQRGEGDIGEEGFRMVGTPRSPAFPPEDKMATRVSSGKVLNAVAKSIPWLIGGSADLAPSTNTNLQFDNAGDFGPGHSGGRNFHFGIREHGMGSYGQRYGADRRAALCCDVFCLQRLSAAVDAIGRHDETARVVHFHARFHRLG